MPQQPYSVAAHFGADWDEDVFTTWLKGFRAQLPAPYVSLGVVYITPRYFDRAKDILELIRLHAGTQQLVGCSTNGLVCAGHELERGGGLVLHLFSLPGAGFAPVRFTQEDLEHRGEPQALRELAFIGRGDSTGMLAFTDPFSVDAEHWLARWNAAWPGTPLAGGLAAGDMHERRTQLYLNGAVYEDGGVAVSLSGRVALRVIVSQGCTPIGDTWTVTRARENVIERIGNRPAYEVLVETYNGLSSEEKTRSGGTLFAGIVVNNYSEDYRRGDFLVRNLIGADPSSGVIALGAHPRAGQAVRFQIRDPLGATEDMEMVLASARATIDARIYGGCLVTCNGRGSGLFHQPHHDAALVQKHFGPGLPLSGFFGNGEIGPVGGRNHLHGYTASLALFVEA
jgi:small ligand-binding sensory domain FIST